MSPCYGLCLQSGVTHLTNRLESAKPVIEAVRMEAPKSVKVTNNSNAVVEPISQLVITIEPPDSPQRFPLLALVPSAPLVPSIAVESIAVAILR